MRKRRPTKNGQLKPATKNPEVKRGYKRLPLAAINKEEAKDPRITFLTNHERLDYLVWF